MDIQDLYQEMILDHNKHPRNCHQLESPSCQANGHNPLCGDRITVYLQMRDDVVEDVSFEGAGCAISTASASLMTESLKGKSKAQAEVLFERFHKLLTSDDAPDTTELGKLAAFAGVRRYPARVKCATLAWHTFQAALGDNNQTISTE